MKRITVLIAVAVCMFLSNTAKAQLGINAGYTIQRISSSLDGSVSYGGDCPVLLPPLMRGFFVGVDYYKNIADDIGISIGLQFRRHSRVMEEGEFDETSFEQFLFDIPLLFDYGYKLTDNLKISAFVGTSFSLAISGQTRRDFGDIFQSWYDNNRLQSFDISATVGLGVQYYHCRLRFGYNHGLLDLGKDNNFDVKVRNTYIGLGYVF